VFSTRGCRGISTPNILNLRSRLRYLSSVFNNLFGPLAADESDIHTTRGHIKSGELGSIFRHALLSVGFRDLKLTLDKYQRRSLLAYPFLIVPLRATNWIVYHRDKSIYRGTVDDRNAWACPSDEFTGHAAWENDNRYQRLSRRNVLLVECVNRLASSEIIATESVEFLVGKTDCKLSLFVWIARKR